MTTLYKPVRIEYDEQAEALPIGTVGYDPPHLYAYIKRARNHWRETGHDVPLTDYEMLPFTAFVPIEAEEEHGARGDGEAEDFYLTRRFVTPWEET